MNNDIKYITPISSDEKNIIKNKTAYALPDRPGYSGMKAAEVKRAFWSPVIDDEGKTSIVWLLERLIDELNSSFDSSFGTLHEAMKLISQIQDMLIGSTPAYSAGYNLYKDAEGDYYVCEHGVNAFAYEIPAYIDGIPVKEIAPHAFADFTRLQYISIPKTIRKIGASAFSNCTGLKEIYYDAVNASVAGLAEDGKTTIYYRPFEHIGMQTNGTKLVIGRNVEMIPAGLFYAWTEDDLIVNNLASVEFEKGSCTTIGARAFYACFRLKNAVFSDTVTTISEHAFRKIAIENLVFGEGSRLSYVGNSSFIKSQLKTVVFPKGVITIGTSVFKQCASLETVRFLGTPRTIASNTFAECDVLSDIYVPWGQGEVDGGDVKWGAPNATVHYNTEV